MRWVDYVRHSHCLESVPLFLALSLVVTLARRGRIYRYDFSFAVLNHEGIFIFKMELPIGATL